MFIHLSNQANALLIKQFPHSVRQTKPAEKNPVRKGKKKKKAKDVDNEMGCEVGDLYAKHLTSKITAFISLMQPNGQK